MQRPNTFIVGAPKCGTTALAQYLSRHKNIFVSDPKEPHYFVNSEMPGYTKFKTLESYLALFSEAESCHSIVVDASVWYLYAKDTARKIKEFCPDAKIIVMLRRPDEMVYSRHSQGLLNLQEDIEDFEVAWKASLKGDFRTSYSKYCKDPSTLQYNNIARYSEQISRYQDYFSDGSIHYIFFDEFKAKTKVVYEEILRFLSLEPDGRQDFPIVNANASLRTKFIERLLKNPPKMIMKNMSRFKNILGINESGITKFLRSINEKSAKRKILSEEIRLEIIENYKLDMIRLQSITGRDLSHWLV